MRRTPAAVGSAAFFALAPGVVAGVLPWSLTSWVPGPPIAGWAPGRAVGAALAVVATIAGQGLLLGRPVLLAYAVGVWAAMAGFVVLYEQPSLSRRFGAEYAAYRNAVHAWWPRLRPTQKTRRLR